VSSRRSSDHRTATKDERSAGVSFRRASITPARLGQHERATWEDPNDSTIFPPAAPTWPSPTFRNVAGMHGPLETKV